MQLSTIPGDAYYYLLSLLKKTKNKSEASTAGAGSRSCGARKRLVGQAKTATPGVQDHVSYALRLKTVFQLLATLGTGLILEGASVHRKLSQPLDNWGDHATAPRQEHSKKFNAGGGACPAGGTQALQPGHSGWRTPASCPGGRGGQRLPQVLRRGVAACAGAWTGHWPAWPRCGPGPPGPAG